MNTDGRPSTGRHVVVAGGSFAGLGAAYTLRERLNPDDRVTVVSPASTFVFAPSLLWAALGESLLNSSFALEPALVARGIDFQQSTVREVRVGDSTVVTENGELNYDRLIIATGGRPDSGAIPGLAGQFRAASWVVGEDSAMEVRNTVRRLYEQPGPLVVGVAQGANYISAAYELVLSLDAELRKKGLRARTPITFATAEPYLGHLGFGQTAAQSPLETLFRERDITFFTGVHFDAVEPNQVRLTGRNLEAAVSMIMPPFTGSVDIWKSAHLTDEAGMIPINAQYRHVHEENVYAAGVAAYFAAPVPPLQVNRPPQTGYLSVHMGKAAAENVASSLGCGVPARYTLPNLVDIRVIDGRNTGLLLASRGRERLQNSAVSLPGRASRYLKASIERYLLWRLRNGRTGLM